MITHGQEETNEMYAMKTLSGIIKNKVNVFSTKWSDIWPLLREDPQCAQLIKVIGMERAHKIFSQCLKDIKADEVQEAHSHLKTRTLNQQQMRNLDKPIHGHPADSG